MPLLYQQPTSMAAMAAPPQSRKPEATLKYIDMIAVALAPAAAAGARKNMLKIISKNFVR